MAQELNARSLAVLAVIKTFWALHGYSPSSRDIGAMAHISSTSMVNYHLGRLRAAGRIKFDDGIARSIVVLEEEAQP